MALFCTTEGYYHSHTKLPLRKHWMLVFLKQKNFYTTIIELDLTRDWLYEHCHVAIREFFPGTSETVASNKALLAEDELLVLVSRS